MTQFSVQASLFDEQIQQVVTPQVPEGATIQERFEMFHAANPQVYRLLKKMCFRVKYQWGKRRYGIKAAFERIRWEYAEQTRGDDYKLNNNFTSRYARLLAENEPELADFFEFRELKAD